MPRRTQLEKDESRHKIIAAAATRIRERGIADTSISNVMHDAGMTHGGFYRHFDSKDDLVEAAIGEAFKAGLDIFDDDEPGTRTQAIAYLEQYLSNQHVEEPAIGCPIPALGAEVSHGEIQWRDALANGVTKACTKLGDGLDELSRDEVLVLISTLVGSLVIARGIGDRELKWELLRASQRHVKALTKQ